MALKTGLRGACQELLTNQAHEQLKAKSGPMEDTPLHVAVRKRDLEGARMFVDTGANVDATNVRNTTKGIMQAQFLLLLLKHFV